MVIRKAKHSDLPAISYVMGKYGKMTVDRSYLNSRDISLVAYLDSGELVGFVWAGLMCQNSLAYIDKFVVDQSHNRKGVGNALYKAMLSELVKRGVRRAFGTIKHDQFHEASAMNALKMACFADKEPYTFVTCDIQNTLVELQHIGGA